MSSIKSNRLEVNNYLNIRNLDHFIFKLIYLFLLSIFFSHLRINGTLYRIHTDYLFYFYWIYCFVYFNDCFRLSKIVILIFAFSWIFSIINILTNVNFNIEMFYWTAQYHLFLFLIYSNAQLISFESFLKVFEKVGKLFLIFFYIFYIFTFFGLNLGVDVLSEDGARPHGFLSEPSNLAFLLPPISLYFFILKKWKLFIFSFLGCLLSISPIVFITLTVTYFVFMTLSLKPFFRVLFIICFALLFVILFNVLQRLDYFDSNSYINAIFRLRDGFNFFTDFEGGFSNSRGEMFLDWIKYNKAFDILLWGSGLGVSNYMYQLLQLPLGVDVNLIFIFINSYGLFITLFILFFILFRIWEIRNDRFRFLFTISVFTTCLINPAGVFLQFYFLFLLFIKPIHKN